MPYGCMSCPDPFTYVDSSIFSRANSDLAGKTLVSSVIDTGVRNCVLLIDGQSNVCSAGQTNYIPTNSTKVDNFNFCDGAMYRATGPLLGCSAQHLNGAAFGRHFGGVLGDLLVNANKFDRAILVPIGVGGYDLAEHVDGAPASTKIKAVAARLAARSIPVTAILWGQGESDNFEGTTQATYTTQLNKVITAYRNAGFGTSVPIFVAKQTMYGGLVSTAIQAAQASVVNHVAGVWAGPDSDSLNSSYRQGGTDFADNGIDAYAALWQTALGLYGAPF